MQKKTVAMSATIQPLTSQVANQYMIYDARLTQPVSAQWFSAAYWETSASVERVGTGRGAAWFIHTQDDAYVLRHYRRGGLMAKISIDRYVWRGLDRTRAWREWQLLAYIQACGLAAPAPVAARVVRHGLLYTADILMRRIADSVALSQYLQQLPLYEQGWQAIGRCIREFHDRLVYHADLNAHNILLNKQGKVYLIDFDKGERKPAPGNWQQANLHRLLRSLDKLQKQHKTFYFTAADRAALQAGYAA